MDGFISVSNQLDAQNFCFTVSLFHASTCFEHVLIIWRSKLHYTTSDIITPIGVMMVKQKFCASSWLVTEITILRCTVSKTSKKHNLLYGGLHVSTLYRVIVRPSLKSSQWMLRKCWDPKLRIKVLKCCANIYFNRQCLQQAIVPKYANIKIPQTLPVSASI